MLLQDYIKMSKGERINMVVGDQFRPLESKDEGIKVGSIVFFYEVIAVKKGGSNIGYEVMVREDRIVDKDE